MKTQRFMFQIMLCITALTSMKSYTTEPTVKYNNDGSVSVTTYSPNTGDYTVHTYISSPEYGVMTYRKMMLSGKKSAPSTQPTVKYNNDGSVSVTTYSPNTGDYTVHTYVSSPEYGVMTYRKIMLPGKKTAPKTHNVQPLVQNTSFNEEEMLEEGIGGL